MRGGNLEGIVCEGFLEEVTLSRDQQSMSRNPLCKSKRKTLSRQRLSKGKHLAAGKASLTGAWSKI